MKANSLTQEYIDELFLQAEKTVETMHGKCTVMVCKFKNGFVLVESSACVDPANYDFDLGISICEARIKEKLWELEGYKLQASVATCS